VFSWPRNSRKVAPTIPWLSKLLLSVKPLPLQLRQRASCPCYTHRGQVYEMGEEGGRDCGMWLPFWNHIHLQT